jgi:hypothetical protein
MISHADAHWIAERLHGIFDSPLLIQELGANHDGVERAFNLAHLGTYFLPHHRHLLMSPVYGELAGFPPMYLSCGARDAVLGRSLDTPRTLAATSVATILSVVFEVDHCFLKLDLFYPVACRELPRALDWLADCETEIRVCSAL